MLSNETTGTTSQHEKSPHDNLPGWAVPILRACRIVSPWLIGVGTLLLLVVMVTLGIVREKHVNLSWTHTMLGYMIFLLSLGFLTQLIGKFKVVIPGWVLLVVGIALYYSPLLLFKLADLVDISLKGGDSADLIKLLTQKLSSFGVFTMIIAIISLVVSYIFMFREREEKRRAIRFQYINPEQTVKQTGKPSLVPKCWQMSRCRPSVRSTCPNFIDHKSCWKRRSGCFCDRKLADFLIGSVGRGEAQEVMDMQMRTGLQQSISKVRDQMTNKNKRPPWREQKFRCHNCPLYIEHEEYKYRYFSWTSILFTGIIALIAWPLFDAGYEKGVNYLTEALKADIVKVLGASSTDLAHSSFEYILYGVLFLLVWGYVIDLMDKFFLEWKM